MTVEIIPVIEIGYHNQGIESPDFSPYWEYPDDWQTYSDKCYSKAGFKDKFIPYSKIPQLSITSLHSFTAYSRASACVLNNGLFLKYPYLFFFLSKSFIVKIFINSQLS